MKRNLIIVMILLLTGCGYKTGNPTPHDFLTNENADIFVIDDMVYSNVADVEWVQERDYTLQEKVGEIKRQTDGQRIYRSFTSNKLPVGAEIYSTDAPFYIVMVDGEEIPYLKMVEG